MFFCVSLTLLLIGWYGKAQEKFHRFDWCMPIAFFVRLAIIR